MPPKLDYLEGRKMCVVFVKVLDAATEKVQLQCLRGRASVEPGRLHVVHAEGGMFTVPSSALPNILPSDGTPLLQDAEYFVLVRTDDNIEFVPPAN